MIGHFRAPRGAIAAVFVICVFASLSARADPEFPYADSRGNYRVYDGGIQYDDGTTVGTATDLQKELGIESLNWAARADAIVALLQSRGIMANTYLLRDGMLQRDWPLRFTEAPQVRDEALQELSRSGLQVDLKKLGGWRMGKTLPAGAQFYGICEQKALDSWQQLQFPQKQMSWSNELGYGYTACLTYAYLLYDRVASPTPQALLWSSAFLHTNALYNIQNYAASKGGDESAGRVSEGDKQRAFTQLAVAAGYLKLVWEADVQNSDSAVQLFRQNGLTVPTLPEARELAASVIESLFNKKPDLYHFTTSGLFMVGHEYPCRLGSDCDVWVGPPKRYDIPLGSKRRVPQLQGG